MVTLHQFDRAWGLPNLSPFCLKAETYLRMTGVEYVHKVADPRKTPKKKLPMLDDGGTLVADSSAIVDHLKKTRGDVLDAKLDEGQRALGHVVRKMLEESFYWPLVWSRWVDDAGWEKMREFLKTQLPPLLRSFLPEVIRGQVKKQIWTQGTGRHSRDEIYALGKADLSAVSAVLGDKPFLLGDEPTSVDATGYAFIALPLLAPPGSPLSEHIRSLPNLVRYVERMKERYWAEPVAS